MKLRKTIIIISLLTGVTALILFLNELFLPYVISGIFIVSAIALMALVNMKDNSYKLYATAQLLSLTGAAYCFELKDIWQHWFTTFISLSIASYIFLLLLGLRRNFVSHALSLLREHPWISGIHMAAGFFLFRSLNVPSGFKQMMVILLLGSALFAAIFVVERYQKVKTRNFYYVLISSILLLLIHSIYLNSIFRKGSEILDVVLIILSCLAAMFSLLGALTFDKSKDKLKES